MNNLVEQNRLLTLVYYASAYSAAGGDHDHQVERPRQVVAWQSATLLPISWKLEQLVQAQVEEPVCPVRQSSMLTIHPFPRCHKQSTESSLSKLAYFSQFVKRL